MLENMAAIEHDGMPEHILDKIAEAIERLPEELRDVVNAIHSERLSYRQTAKRMGYASHSTVFYKLQKAYKILRKELKNVYEDSTGVDRGSQTGDA